MVSDKEEVTRGKIISEFFTNLAVAWFSAGIIAPLFTPNLYSLNSILISFVGTVAFIGSAIIFKDIK